MNENPHTAFNVFTAFYRALQEDQAGELALVENVGVGALDVRHSFIFLRAEALLKERTS